MAIVISTRVLAMSAISPLGMAGFNAAKALSTRNDSPEEASRPWDKGRDGFVLGEGAGVLILEELEAARKRSAKIYAEVTGFGQSDDAYHITAPAEDGIGAKLGTYSVFSRRSDMVSIVTLTKSSNLSVDFC